MSCHKFESAGVRGIICLPNIYEFKGFILQWHNHLGPFKLKKDFEPAKREGRKFYKVATEFAQLSEQDRKQYQVYG